MAGCTASGSSRWHNSLCDTAGVAPLSRRLRRIEEPRLAALGLTVPLLLILAAYGYAMTSVSPTTNRWPKTVISLTAWSAAARP